jgi:hypothetical protein
MPKMNSIVLSQKSKNIDLLYYLDLLSLQIKRIHEHLKKNNPDIEKIVIYKLIWLNELRSKFHLLLASHQQQEAHKLLMIL